MPKGKHSSGGSMPGSPKKSSHGGMRGPKKKGGKKSPGRNTY